MKKTLAPSQGIEPYKNHYGNRALIPYYNIIRSEEPLVVKTLVFASALSKNHMDPFVICEG